ncbi:type I restriction enzyme, R subunit [Entomoplasma ellychniae]|uniref:Type I restriction enzyme endonuclease subunit n=1 Tax=Entomoplasma ellychniae TaxID=2114 RepID=A0A8E2UAE4_9MOLU|nr:HsdR family type I site-specific deoxyribonuclease [Entomoplasma ellychniae]PPE05099.1 type I restriction enzyme, R subunit [Entomoplasma ellychniae]
MIINEKFFEEEVESELQLLGWEELSEKNFYRNDYAQVINFKVLNESIQRINNIAEDKAELVIREINKNIDSWENLNIKGMEIINNGIKIYDEIEERNLTIKIISENVDDNNFSYYRQFEITDGYNKKRIPDIVLFINGLPIAVLELKQPLAIENIEEAFKQNESLKYFKPELWYFNIINFVSNRTSSKYGSTTAGLKHFYGWNNWSLENNQNPITMLFNHKSLIDIIFNFNFYSDDQNPIKYLAAPHQIRAVNKTIDHLKEVKDNRGGIIWHTQGSGKSVTMVFLTRYIIKTFGTATVLLVTDRKDLDQQLYKRFLNAETFLRNKSKSIASRAELVSELNDKKHFGIYFTTVQKFVEETGVLTNRDDVFILVDEAHRTQNNINGERVMSKEQEEFVVKFGYAKYMREAFPNAKITGFTGTPLMGEEKDTRNIFGDYIDTYPMNQAVEDGATVPIYYEMWKPNLILDKKYLDEMDKIQKEYKETLDPNDIGSEQKIETLLKAVNKSIIFEDEKIIAAKADKMIEHLNKRKDILNGKAMIVANSRNAAYKYYLNIITKYPDYKDKTILVMTDSNKDSIEMASAIVNKNDMNKVASEFRKPNSKYKIAIVVDMWLTGFDVPDLDVMYVDKIIKWHNLMQAIARVNRTYEDKVTKKSKEAGLIVDFVGIWKYISDALIQYANGSSTKIDIQIDDIDKAKEKLNELFDIVNDYYIKDLKSFSQLNSKEQYEFVIDAYDKLLNIELFSVDEKNKFIKLARKSKRFYKISYTSITEEELLISKCIETINSLITSSAIQNDSKLTWTIESIKEAIKNAVTTADTSVIIDESTMTKDINKVAGVLSSEAEKLAKSKPRVAATLYANAIKLEIDEISKIKPYFAKLVSEKLKDIISELESSREIDEIIELLIMLSKEIKEENDKPLEFEDIELQIFYDILSNDQFLQYNKNSETLRAIAQDLREVVRENNSDQYLIEKRIKSIITTELKKLLKTKYQYPPDGLYNLSENLIKEVTNSIKGNKKAFRKDD